MNQSADVGSSGNRRSKPGTKLCRGKIADFGGLAEVVAIVCTMERAPGDRREAEIQTAGLVGCGNVSSEDSG